MKSGIYKITINNKLYVGYAKNFEKRKNKHYKMLIGKKHINPYLQNSFIKYNEFNFDIIEECAEDELEEKEMFWIKELDTFEGDGYNLTAGGDGWLGGIHTEEARRKISEARKGNQNALGAKRSAETIRKMSEAGKGKTLSVEHRRKMSEAGKGNQNALGHKHSVEIRRKISEGNKRGWAKRKQQESESYIMNELETQKRIVSNGI